MSPRRWLVLRVRSPSGEEAGALLTEGLLSLGGRAVWEERGWLLTHLPEPSDPEAFARRARDRLAGLASPDLLELETEWQAHEDWAETWKRGLAPRRVTPRLVVTPSWIEPSTVAGDVVVTLDPGMAFGNAEHGTTRGCLRLLDGVLRRGDRVLDLGAGSAVLSIAAVLLGAREAVAVEGDPLAWEAIRENVERNGVAGRVVLRREWATAASLAALGGFDGAVANIEREALERLLPGIARSVGAGGWVVLSGVTDGDVADLTALAREGGLGPEAQDADGDWRSLLFRRA